MRANLLLALLVSAAVGVPGLARADVFSYDLLDHPDGNQSLPFYGLRLDGLSWFLSGTGGMSETWSFSFDAAGAGMVATLDDVAMTLTFHGTAVGGKDVDQDPAGPSTVDIWFQYDFEAGDLGFFNGHPSLMISQTDLGDPAGTGTLTFLDGNSAADGVPNGSVVNMVSYGLEDDGTGLTLIFRADEHRLNGLDPALGFTDCDDPTNPHPGCDLPVVRGWLGLVEDLNDFDAYDVFHTSSQDWLATTPEPAVLPLMGMSLLVLTWLGRRRAE